MWNIIFNIKDFAKNVRIKYFLVFMSCGHLWGFRENNEKNILFSKKQFNSFWNKTEQNKLRDPKVFWLISFLLWTKIYVILLWQINFLNQKQNQMKIKNAVYVR